MKERLLEFLKAENKSSAQLAEEIGVQPSGISHILSGRNNPSLDFVLKMLEKYAFLSSDWLLFGKGTMYKEAPMQKLFDDSLNFGQESKQSALNKEVVSREMIQKPENMEIEEPIDKTSVEKIVWFYKNKSFLEYFPDDHNR
jgi:transcriptional regulator with XRE-family HTH domain